MLNLEATIDVRSPLPAGFRVKHAALRRLTALRRASILENNPQADPAGLEIAATAYRMYPSRRAAPSRAAFDCAGYHSVR